MSTKKKFSKDDTETFVDLCYQFENVATPILQKFCVKLSRTPNVDCSFDGPNIIYKTKRLQWAITIEIFDGKGFEYENQVGLWGLTIILPTHSMRRIKKTKRKEIISEMIHRELREQGKSFQPIIENYAAKD